MEPPAVRQIPRPAFKHRHHLLDAGGASDGGPTGALAAVWVRGTTTSNDGNISQYTHGGPLVTRAPTPSHVRVERGGYDRGAQNLGMEMEGIDHRGDFPGPPACHSLDGKQDPQFSAAIAEPQRLMHDCPSTELTAQNAAMLLCTTSTSAAGALSRVKEYGAVGAFVRPPTSNGRYWHSNYWDRTYGLLQGLESHCASTRALDVLPEDRAGFGEKNVHAPRRKPFDRDAARPIAPMSAAFWEFYPRLRVASWRSRGWGPGMWGDRMGSAPAP